MTITVDLTRWEALFSLKNSSLLIVGSEVPVDHFGYDHGLDLGDSYSDDTYMLFDGLTEQFYPGVYPQYKNDWKFTPQDFAKLNNDPTINLIYDDSNNQIFYVIGKNQTMNNS